MDDPPPCLQENFDHPPPFHDFFKKLNLPIKKGVEAHTMIMQ